MALGMIGYKMAKESGCRKSRLLRLILLISIIGIILFFSHSKFDFICAVLMVVFITNEFMPRKTEEPKIMGMITKKLCKHLGEISLAVYFSHWYIILEWWNVRQKLYEFIDVNMWVEMIIFTLMVILFSEGLNWIIRKTKR